MEEKTLVIAIKVGSALLTDGLGKINNEFIAEVCRQVACLMRLGHHVLIISSGAIASDQHLHRSKNLRAAVGQGKIYSTYDKYLEANGFEAAQLLLTDDQLLAGKTSITKGVIQEAFKEKVVCVINANDVIDSTEINALKYCSDNDKLTELVCRLLEADMAIIAFAEQGVKDDNKNVLHEIRKKDLAKALGFAKGGSKLGHGKDGMHTKITVLGSLSAAGTTAVLVPGHEANFILRAFAGEKNFGTKFIAE